VDGGLFDFAEVARLLGVSDAMVGGICLGDGRRPALVPAAHGWALSFHDLVSASVVVTLRTRQFSYDELHALKEELAREIDVYQPFGNRRSLQLIGVAGRDRLRNFHGVWELIGDRQLTLREPVELYLEQIQFDAEGLALRWAPFERVVLDPEIQAGSPCIDGTRFETIEVFDLAQQGYDVDDIARDFELELAGVECALSFEQLLADNVGIRALATAAHR
jgi:uncharacterized protein (DUF433 family)